MKICWRNFHLYMMDLKPKNFIGIKKYFIIDICREFIIMIRKFLFIAVLVFVSGYSINAQVKIFNIVKK